VSAESFCLWLSHPVLIALGALFLLTSGEVIKFNHMLERMRFQNCASVETWRQLLSLEVMTACFKKLGIKTHQRYFITASAKWHWGLQSGILV
jgi:hypothetical protein